MGKHTQTAQPIQFWKWLQILSHTEPLNIFFWLLTYFFVISVFSFKTSVDWKKKNNLKSKHFVIEFPYDRNHTKGTNTNK